MGKRKILFLVLVVAIVVGGMIRLWRLGDDGHPLLWDEAALGYNGYSILRTGRDEYGTFLPLILKSFGDYKPALYAYTTIVPVWMLGLSEFSTRLPSAVAGVVIVLLVYLLAEELLGEKMKRVGVWAAIVAAANPWLVHFSRGAWEANVNLMLTLAGIWLFLAGRKRPINLVLSALCFGLTFFTYQSAKLFTPLIIIGLLFFFRSDVSKVPNRTLKVASVVFLLFLGLVVFLARGTSGRLSVYNVFAYRRSPEEVETVAARERTTTTSLKFLLFHGEWLTGARRFLEGYFSYFSGRFLFNEGDWTDVRQGSPYVGEFYWIDLPFFTLGLVLLVRLRKRSTAGFLGYWLVVSPLPAALSRDVVSSVRALNIAVPLILVGGLGVSTLVSIGSRRLSARLALGVVLIIGYLWSVGFYLDSYFVHAQVTLPDQRLYGYMQTVELLAEVNRGNRPVFFTQKMGQPYIYVLFYNKVDPTMYQSQARLTENSSGDVGKVERFENYNFRNLYWPTDRGLKNAFFVGTDDELPLRDIDDKQAMVVGEVKRPDGTQAFRVVKTF